MGLVRRIVRIHLMKIPQMMRQQTPQLMKTLLQMIQLEMNPLVMIQPLMILLKTILIRMILQMMIPLKMMIQLVIQLEMIQLLEMTLLMIMKITQTSLTQIIKIIQFIGQVMLIFFQTIMLLLVNQQIGQLHKEKLKMVLMETLAVIGMIIHVLQLQTRLVTVGGKLNSVKKPS